MRLDPFRYDHTNYAAEMILRWQKQNPARSSSYSDVKCWNRYVGRDAGGMPFIPLHVSLVFASLYFTHSFRKRGCAPGCGDKRFCASDPRGGFATDGSGGSRPALHTDGYWLTNSQSS